MKKLLSVLGATALITTSTTSVLACSSNANYKQFMKWIENQDTFLLYMGAENCPYCNDYRDAKEQLNGTDNSIESKLSDLNQKYVAEVNAGDGDVDPYNDFGDQLVREKIDYHEFIIEDLNDSFQEKWSKNILEWVIDQIVETYINIKFSHMPDFYSSKQKYINIAKPLVKTALTDKPGIPFFLFIRNGKLVSWTSGYNKSEISGNYTEDFNKWFEPLSQDFMNQQMSIEMVKKIDESQSTGGGEGETTTPDPTLPPDPTIPATFNYNDIDLNKYSTYFK